MASFDVTATRRPTAAPRVVDTNNNNNNVNAPNTTASPAAQFASPQFTAARKRILTEQHMDTFKSAPCFREIIDFLGDLAVSVLETQSLPAVDWTTTPKNPSASHSSAAAPAAVADASKDTAQQQQEDKEKKEAVPEKPAPDGQDATAEPQLKPVTIQRIAVAVDNAERSTHKFESPVTPVFIDFFTQLHQWITDIPLERLLKSRFGNLAFRNWQMNLRSEAKEWAQKIVTAAAAASSPVSSATIDDSNNNNKLSSIVDELVPYLFDAFGNATRIDYGTGHELHFVLVIFVLFKNGLLGPTTAATATEGNSNINNGLPVLREMVLIVMDDYWRLMTRLQQHYRLEPAGSHGVWGLDDFHHIPFILGAAQLSPSGSWDKDCMNRPSSQSSAATIVSAPLPDQVPSARSCEELAPRNFLFRAVQNIHRSKSGVFGEHSPVLQSVSSIASWPRVLTGMIKMFEGEVLGKFLIVQHLLFGTTFAWPEQQQVTASVKRP